MVRQRFVAVSGCGGWLRRSVGIALCCALLLLSCNERAIKAGAADAGEGVAGLSPEQASRVVAKVGDKVITLGDFARTLDRMDQFDRLRYQSKERRRELLNEIVDVELLAQEARKRGLDKRPDAQDAIRQVLGEAMLAKAKQGLPAPGEIPDAEVRAYYDSHKDQFSEPERRRVAAIVLADKKQADQVLKLALKIKNPAEWGELWAKHSVTAKKEKAASPDMAGDLGMVDPPGDTRAGDNAKVPEAVRAAVYKIGNVGAVADQIVAADGKFYVVRMNGISAGHTRSLAEADRSIRVLLLQQKFQQREDEIEADLRKRFPVEIDERALSSVQLPPGLDKEPPGPPPAPPDGAAQEPSPP